MTDPRIRIVKESEATGETAQLYEEIKATFGIPFVPDIVKLVSIRPDFLRVLHDGYRAMWSRGLTHALTERRPTHFSCGP